MKSNEDRENREKKEDKFHNSIPDHKIGFLRFLRFIEFTILLAFKSFVIRP